jgi:hypothetical protein
MRRYTVVWWPRARDQIAEIWLQATHRQLVTFAADEVDQRLRDHPTEWGAVVKDGVTCMAVQMLRVYFRVSEDDRRVEVLDIVAVKPGIDDSNAS